MKKLYIILALVLLPYASFAEDANLRTITVTGKASQDFNPDIAEFSVNVIGKSIKPEEARTTHDKMLRALKELAKKNGIDDKDLSTGYSSINPNYEYKPDNKRKLVDYSAQTQVNITLRDLKNVGQFQDMLVAGGFDTIQGPNYELDKEYTYHDKILASAVENAKQKAQNIAKKVNETLDKPVSITEGGVNSYTRQPMYSKSMIAALPPMAPSESQPSGVTTISASVTATFSLK